MGTDDDTAARARAFSDEVAARLGAHVVGDAARDERLVAHVSGRALGRPHALVRPRSTAEVVAVVDAAIRHGQRLVPVGHATTFWGGLEVEGAVVVDTTGLDTPTTIEPEARTAHVGAGVRVRTLDRLARGHGLCLPARPDGAGDTSLGSLFSVASCAGLGLGVALPVGQVEGGLAVSGRGEVVRFGAGPYLHGRATGERGLPGLRSVLEGAEGRAAIVTELFVRLARAPHVVALESDGGGVECTPALVDAVVAAARAGFDDGTLETTRLELVADARAPRGRFTHFARFTSPRGLDEAEQAARRAAAALAPLGLRAGSPRLETEAARRGEPGTDDFHWSFPEGATRSRLHGLGFHGLEATAAHGADARALVAAGLALFEAAHALGPAVRRFAVYPAPTLVSVGVQLLVDPAGPALERTVALLEAHTATLLRLGVPYRGRGRFAAGLAAHATTPDASPSARALEAAFDALDPDRRIFPAQALR